MHIKSHLGSHKCSHPGDQWPHAASLIGPVTHLTNLVQSHTNTQHRCPPHPYPCGSSQTQPGVLRVFTPGHSQAQPGERFGGDPQRNTNFKQTLHNKPRREAWGCCAVGDLEDVASNPLENRKSFCWRIGQREASSSGDWWVPTRKRGPLDPDRKPTFLSLPGPSPAPLTHSN